MSEENDSNEASSSNGGGSTSQNTDANGGATSSLTAVSGGSGGMGGTDASGGDASDAAASSGGNGGMTGTGAIGGSDNGDIEPPEQDPPPPHFALDCDAPEVFGSTVTSDWEQAELDTPFGERGYSAKVDLRGMPLYVEEGPIFATLPGGFVDMAFDASSVYVFIDAKEVFVTIAGQDPNALGAGLVVFRTSGRNAGSGIRFDDAEIQGIAALSAQLDPVPVSVPNRQSNHRVRGLALDTEERMAPTPGLPSEMVSVQESARRMADGEIVIETTPVLPIFVGTDGAAQTLTDVEQMTVRGQDGMFVSTLRPYTIESDRLSLELEGEGRFALTSDFEGSVEVESLGYPRPEDEGAPAALFGTQASLSITEAGEVTGTAQLTQALDEAGLLVPAHVQMAPTSVHVELAPGEQILQTINVREASFLGDGIVEKVGITGDLPEGMLLLRADTTPSWIRIFDIVDDGGWVGAPALAVIATLGSVTTLVGETFECVFSFGFSCDLGIPDGFKSYDTVAQAGEANDFEIALNGSGKVGDRYTGTLTFEGQNYCPVQIEIQVDIVCKPTGDEICDDGNDNDCNGKTDCEDTACLGLACNPDNETAICTAASACE
ncbi:MAG TPA: hypothetical protein VI197_34930 [Polyangiaceae bacterium]